ncbi:hypothetical protein NOR53_1128 [gamma proteobacterium NOR5-3]|nr:hypothetical protein NOR53_1128 [gamma proteobacterium NOR5-3]
MKIDEAIIELSGSDEPPFELIGQCFDALVQAIEHRHLELESRLPVSRGLGELSKWVASVEPASLARSLEMWRALGKVAISELYPTAVEADRFAAASLSWVRETEWALPEYSHRVRYAPTEVNQTGFEWAGRFRNLKLMHGSVTRAKADVLVLSSEISAEGIWAGQALGAVERQITLGPVERRLFHGDGLEVVVRSALHPESPFDRVLVVGVPVTLGVLSKEDCQSLFKAMVSSLRAEETWENDIQTVSCSLLGGNRIGSEMEMVAGAAVEAGRQWLRSSESGKEFQLVLLNRSEIDAFSTAMDQVLGRSVERVLNNPVAEPLRLQLIESLGELPKSLRTAAEPLMDTLISSEGLTVELVCAFARSWVEHMVMHLLQSNGLKPAGVLIGAIEQAREAELISPWIASYMHTCRIMGNKSVHPPNSPPAYPANRLLSADLVNVMAAMHALAVFAAAKD